MLSSGATYIARGYSHGIEQLQRLFKEAILHRGFSFVDVLQVCVSYNNLYESYNQWTYAVEDNDRGSFEQARKIIRSWNYNRSDLPIPLGCFYQIDTPRFDQSFSSYRPCQKERESKIEEILENFI
jgi:2-oxoglutarate ferredoxin oxidoreductase subunit beta